MTQTAARDASPSAGRYGYGRGTPLLRNGGRSLQASASGCTWHLLEAQVAFAFVVVLCSQFSTSENSGARPRFSASWRVRQQHRSGGRQKNGTSQSQF